MPAKKKKPEEMAFEEASTRLEEIVKELEQGEAPLEEMLKLYEEGTALLRRANSLLEDAEKRVSIVDGEEIRPFA